MLISNCLLTLDGQLGCFQIELSRTFAKCNLFLRFGVQDSSFMLLSDKHKNQISSKKLHWKQMLGIKQLMWFDQVRRWCSADSLPWFPPALCFLTKWIMSAVIGISEVQCWTQRLIYGSLERQTQASNKEDMIWQDYIANVPWVLNARVCLLSSVWNSGLLHLELYKTFFVLRPQPCI